MNNDIRTRKTMNEWVLSIKKPAILPRYNNVNVTKDFFGTDRFIFNVVTNNASTLRR